MRKLKISSGRKIGNARKLSCSGDSCGVCRWLDTHDKPRMKMKSERKDLGLHAQVSTIRSVILIVIPLSIDRVVYSAIA